MELSEKVRMLQVVYAGALADNVLRLGNEGVLDKVTQQKGKEQMLLGKTRAAQMGIASKEDVFLKLSDLMGCADWTVTQNTDEKGFTAKATRCMLCMLAKKMGAQSPCRIYCLDPMKGMLAGIDPEADFLVNSTLYENGECSVTVQGK